MDPPKKRHASQPARPCEWSWCNEKCFLEEAVGGGGKGRKSGNGHFCGDLIFLHSG